MRLYMYLHTCTYTYILMFMYSYTCMCMYTRMYRASKETRHLIISYFFVAQIFYLIILYFEFNLTPI